ncbi:hypothetical protein MHYP_G00026290 [Metynnis hypsauchen]
MIQHGAYAYLLSPPPPSHHFPWTAVSEVELINEPISRRNSHDFIKRAPKAQRHGQLCHLHPRSHSALAGCSKQTCMGLQIIKADLLQGNLQSSPSLIRPLLFQACSLDFISLRELLFSSSMAIFPPLLCKCVE